ncbi:aliphatic sulfonate ABC transporter substrate-binding protein [Leuconostoc mesenteroides]|uniref:Putative aliphatic sulfonates-binding protein n=1 Tax=Leuconostoc mesenteroides subsp. mesenteroides (strain ATCC 8293 / DSM 20343 / BCRC 11652 / CCM 1803 / JCM 6124 / NCDO 523 / NBRC 100496 / NCIMB 8023 / NCTC 12954 / NRRL B-1118 / 37Y) TaxID=203120 RepID=Q03X22_LEUMM|nr:MULTISPECIES: aliphatic sulfonate ABC transporter substrate-binding protein [Leuconostoc]ABJ62250.1 ABC-type nitrate/sulfonate/bicarbonate transport systems, periplasmic component [Leuconostoc mesenteroides subsp. mesenteroides ATCC 8293]MCT3042960.1 aliphatic sulfonate ABC transporter substrate-binding protein [Leuconostoc mesenteroides]MCT8385948.1 aliphatic sulfonate ABC transporter substrate-binding protein [Leuconostoc mesenteroides]MDG9747338.1 aliphatic sulfonate ABC transporter subst
MTQLVRKTMLVIFLFLWAVCAIYGYTQTIEKKTTLQTITIGYQKGDPIDIAKQHGELIKNMKKQGYKIVYREFADGAAEMQALASGSIDYARTGDTPPVTAQASKTDITYIAVGASKSSGSAILIPQSSSLSKISDLKGKRIAYTQGTSSQYLLLSALKKAGLSSSDVTLVNMKQTDASIAFSQGKIDAWVTWDPYTAQAEVSQNAKVLTTGKRLSKNRDFLLSTKSIAKKNKKVSSYLVKYLSQDMKWANNNKSEVSKLLAKSLSMKQSVIEKMVKRRDFTMTGITSAVLKEQQSIANLFYEEGLINKKITIKDTVLNTTN